MNNKASKLTIVLLVILAIIIDLIVYLFLGLMLMNYEDFYDGSKGPLWSLESMNTIDQVFFFAYTFWIGINILAGGLLVYWFLKKFSKGVLSRYDDH